jgi:translation initiation factor 2 beta subunit (eIF-2beta)/eIF-5
MRTQWTLGKSRKRVIARVLKDYEIYGVIEKYIGFYEKLHATKVNSK